MKNKLFGFFGEFFFRVIMVIGKNLICVIMFYRAELQVGEHIVGAILGPGGKALLEIQHFSGANIQISKVFN